MASPENVKKRKNLKLLNKQEEDENESKATLGGSPIGRRNIQIYGANIIKLNELPKPKKIKRKLS